VRQHKDAALADNAFNNVLAFAMVKALTRSPMAGASRQEKNHAVS
jgi:hypothetical protein